MSAHADPPQADPIVRWCVIVLTVAVVFFCLSVAQDILAPTILALITGVILSPITAVLERLGLPRGAVAILVVLFGISVLATGAFLLEPIIWKIIDEIPRIRFEIRGFVDEFRNLIRGLDEVNKQVEQALGSSEGAAAAATQTAETGAAAMPKLTDALFLAPVVAAQTMVFLGTLFFFLLTRQNIYAWIARRVHLANTGGALANTGGAEVLRRFRTAERMVSRYFLTVSIINAGLGTALAGVLALIGLPGALIWGVVAATLNFVLYLGPMMVTAGLLLTALVAFDGIWVVVPPLVFIGLNLIEGQFVTPTLVGRHVSVNPLLVFTSLVVWMWLWGPIGGIVAIPVLVIVLALLDIFETGPGARRGD